MKGCDHKFVDSTFCLKCGWRPEPSSPSVTASPEAQIATSLKWIAQMQEEIRNEGHAGWGNTLDDIAAILASTREALTQAQQERDKWLKAFNESEQFQNGPTKRAEAAEAALAQQAQEIARVKRYLAGYGLAGRQALTDLFPDTLRPHGEELK